MLHLLAYIVVVVLAGWVVIWLLGQAAPSHPAIIDRIVWIVVVLFVILILWDAFGVGDIPVPRLRRY